MSGGVPAGLLKIAKHSALNDPIEDMPMAERGAAIRTLRAMLAAVPTPPIEGRDADVERVLTVLRKLEAACDELAANRSQETYLCMIDCDGATPHLEALDDARRDARAALQALGERG